MTRRVWSPTEPPTPVWRSGFLSSNYFGELLACGLAAGLKVGLDVIVGLVAVAGLATLSGVAVGFTAPGDAGRNPRLLGLVSMLAARLLTIFASFIAVSRRAA